MCWLTADISAAWSQSTCSHIPRCAPPSSVPHLYLTDVDPRVFLVVSSVADSQPQLLLAANAAQLHLLQESTWPHMMPFAKAGKNYVAQRSAESPTPSCAATDKWQSFLSMANLTPTHQDVSEKQQKFVVTAQPQDTLFCVLLLGGKIFCELRKFQYITGSRYSEIIQENMPNWKIRKCIDFAGLFCFWVMGADLQYIT